MYLYGLLKTTVVSPPLQIAPSSPQLDLVAFLNYQVLNMSPEEVLPIFYPQVYDVSDRDLTDAEFPPVS
jgi:hypothetical protein